jgi:type III pantothenate kinase
MLLGFDIGNSNVVAALFAADGRIVGQWRHETGVLQSLDDVADWLLPELPPTQLKPSVIVSVVPSAVEAIAGFCQTHLQLTGHVLTRADLLAIQPTKLSQTDTIGLDRLLNAIAARHLFKPPLLVLDCGTASNIEVVDADGSLLGGAIMPGIALMRDALRQAAAANFPEVPIAATPYTGNNTVAALQSGLFWLNIHGLAGLLTGMMAENGWNPQQTPVVLTGGLAGAILPELQKMLPTLCHQPDLTLQGLWQVTQKRV